MSFGETLRTTLGSAKSRAASAASTVGSAATATAGAVGSAATSAAGTVADVVTQKTPREKFERTLADNRTLIDGLPAAPANLGDAKKALSDRHAALLARVNAIPAKPDKNDKDKQKTLQVDIDKLSSDVSAMGNYAIALDKAQALEREVMVLNRGTTAYQQPVTDLLNEADTALKADPVAATATLKKAEAVAKRQKATAGTQRGTALDDAKHKPLFEDKVRRIRAAIKQLEALPGTAEARGKLDGLVLAGQAAAQPGNYAAAYKALQGLSGTLKAGMEASEGFARKAGGPEFEKQLKATEVTFGTFSELSAFADPAAVAKYRQQIDDTLKTLEVAPTPKKTDAASAELTRIDTELKAAMTDRQKDSADWDRIIIGVQEGTAVLRSAAPSDVYGGLLASQRAAETLHGLQDHKQAVRQLRKLRTEVNAELPKYQKHYEDWQRLSKIVDEKYLADLHRLSTEIELPAAKGVVGILLSNYATAVAQLPDLHNYAAAVVHAQAVIDRFPSEVGPALAKYDALQPRREKASEDLIKACDELTVQIDVLKGKGGDTTPSLAVIDQARREWGKAVQSETDGTVLADAFVAIVAPVNKEKTRLMALLADPAQLQASQAEGTKASRQSQLEKSTAEVRARLKVLGEDFPADVGPFQTLLDAILRQAKAETDAGKPVMQKQVDEITELLKQVDAKQLERKTAIAAQAKLASEAAAAALGQVSALRKAHGKFVKFFEALEGEVRDAAAMTSSTVAKVVDASVARLTAGGDIFKKLKDLKDSPDFDLIDRIISDINLFLDDAAMKECKPAQRKAFQTRLKQEVLPAAYSQSPKEAVELLRNFRTEIRTAKDQAATANADRERIKALVAAATTALDKLDKDKAPKVYDSLVARIKAAGASSEGREYDSISKLNTVMLIIDRLASGKPEAATQLVEMEQTLTNNEFKEEQAKAQWEAQVGLYEKNELRLAKAAYDAVPGALRDAPRMQQLTDLEKEGRKLAGNGQFREALLRLDAARLAARSLQASPMHADVSARNELKPAAGKWKAAVGGFVSQLNELADTIRKQAAEDGTVDPAAPDLAAKAVREIATSFDPLKFDSVIARITAEGTNLTTRRKEKETALRFVRNYLDTLASDPLLKHVETNPFKPVPLKPLRDRLNDLNLNLQRA